MAHTDTATDAGAKMGRITVVLDDELLPMPLSHALAKSQDKPQQARQDISKAIDDPANQDRVRVSGQLFLR